MMKMIDTCSNLLLRQPCPRSGKWDCWLLGVSHGTKTCVLPAETGLHTAQLWPSISTRSNSMDPFTYDSSGYHYSLINVYINSMQY